MERAHQTLKIQIQKLKEREFKFSSPHQILQHALFVINILNTDSAGTTAMLRHWCTEQLNAKPLVKWKDLLSGQWKGPDPLYIYIYIAVEDVLVFFHRMQIFQFRSGTG